MRWFSKKRGLVLFSSLFLPILVHGPSLRNTCNSTAFFHIPLSIYTTYYIGIFRWPHHSSPCAPEMKKKNSTLFIIERMAVGEFFFLRPFRPIHRLWTRCFQIVFTLCFMYNVSGSRRKLQMIICNFALHHHHRKRLSAFVVHTQTGFNFIDSTGSSLFLPFSPRYFLITIVIIIRMEFEIGKTKKTRWNVLFSVESLSSPFSTFPERFHKGNGSQPHE